MSKELRSLVAELIKSVKDRHGALKKESLENTKRLMEIQKELREIEPKLDRSHSFLESHANSFPPLCPNCFIDHGKEIPMKARSSEQVGIDEFECGNCGQWLEVKV